MGEENEQHLKNLIEENIALTKAIHRSVERTRRYILWGRIIETMKFLFIIGALAGTYYFVQSYLDKFLGIYQRLYP